MKNQILIIFSLFIVLSACGKKSTPEKSNTDTTIAVKDTLPEPQKPIKEKDDIDYPDSSIIKWKDCSVSLEGLYFFKEGEEGIIFDEDTVTIWSELGTSTQDSWISISGDKLTDIKVEECYETSITIQNEGPHCDLIDWKHYTSKWKPLKKNEQGKYITLTFTEEEWKKFPSVKTDDIKKAVKGHCEKHWHDLVKDIKSPTDYPSSVGISRQFIRITARNIETGVAVVKLIEIITPMGC